MVPNEVKSVVDNVIMTVAEASILPKRKQGIPCENGPNNGQRFEFDKLEVKV